MTGRTRRDGVAAPRWSSNVAGYGDGQMTGQADDATETRIRWPARNRYPAGRIDHPDLLDAPRLERLRTRRATGDGSG